jgi:predicted ATPase/DNA-binding winged helix-turn-helix (wHTH) protein
MRVWFEDFELDTTTFELRRDGVPVHLEPQAFDVLAHLIRHRDRVVSKEELLDEVWGDRFVSVSALTSRVKQIRRALGEGGRVQHHIRTMHGRGYRFITELTAAGDVDGTPGAGAGAITRDAGTGHTLPTERTPLFGREAAISDVVCALDGHRLVTLLGIGGSGKTRLAVAAARRLLERFPDGVWFVDLVPTRDGRSVETAVAHAAGLALSAGDVRGQLARVLAPRVALFVLDNAEHVRNEVADLLDDLLDHTTAPRFLVTSRVPLDLPDECRVPVQPLEFADLAAPAVELFVSAAERSGAAVAAGDRPAAQRICHHLDGLPLAIELAAAQLRVLSPDDVAHRLDERFELLQARRGRRWERHASLRSVLASTWALLDAREAELLGRLAAFPGPFRLVDIEQRCADLAPGETAATMARLVDHSLVVSADADRFTVLESVRLFANRQADSRRHRAGHALWCLDRVGQDVHEHLYDRAAAHWCTEHYDDLRAAELFLLWESRPAAAAMLVAGEALSVHYDPGARGADMLARVQDHLRGTDDPALHARLHFTGVHAAMAARAPSAIAEHGQGAVRAARDAGDRGLLAVALVLCSWSTVLTAPAEALAMVERANALAEEVGDAAARNLADSYRAFHLAMLRRYDEAIAQADAVIARASARAVPGQDTHPAIVAAAACRAVHAPDDALRWADHLLSRGYEGSPMWGDQVLVSAMHAARGAPAEATALVEAVRDRLGAAGQDSLPDILVPAAVLAHRLDEDGRAARWLRAVRAAGRPTQSFQVTCVYRRLRERVGTSAEDPLATATLEEIGDEALAWMRTVAAG